MHPPADRDEDRVRALRRVGRELRRIELLESGPIYCVAPSRLVAVSAALHRLRRYGHLLDWDWVESRFVDMLDDELPGDVTRWLEPLEPVA